ncbi:MAG: thioesterase family protein [Bernardetiaceae bacterium]|nr:thioesterase family protein [Bernardetiaceae bacterium]
MARIKIELPDNFRFQTEIAVRISDLNYGAHVGNDAILSMMHEARVQFLQAEGYKSELEVEGLGLIMADSAIQYRAEGFYGDIFCVEVTPADITTTGFDIIYRFSEKSKGKDIAYGKTGMVFFDYQNRKVARCPKAILDKWQ